MTPGRNCSMRISARWTSGISRLRSAGVLQVEGQALLAAVEHDERGAFSVHDRLETPRVLAARPLDLDHLGAGFRQHQPGQRARQQCGEIED